MDINFDDVIQLLEIDFQDFQNENKKSFSTIVTLPAIKHYTNNSSKLLDIFDCLHIQTIYRSIDCHVSNSDLQSLKPIKFKKYLFLALRNVEIKKEYQKQGVCTKLIQCLLNFCYQHKINFWIDDVVNDDLYHFLKNNLKQNGLNCNILII